MSNSDASKKGANFWSVAPSYVSPISRGFDVARDHRCLGVVLGTWAVHPGIRGSWGNTTRGGRYERERSDATDQRPVHRALKVRPKRVKLVQPHRGPRRRHRVHLEETGDVSKPFSKIHQNWIADQIPDDTNLESLLLRAATFRPFQTDLSIIDTI